MVVFKSYPYLDKRLVSPNIQRTQISTPIPSKSTTGWVRSACRSRYGRGLLPQRYHFTNVGLKYFVEINDDNLIDDEAVAVHGKFVNVLSLNFRMTNTR